MKSIGGVIDVKRKALSPIGKVAIGIRAKYSVKMLDVESYFPFYFEKDRIYHIGRGISLKHHF